MGTTLATKSDLLLIRQEMENRFSLASRDIDSLRKDIESLGASSRHELESLRNSTTKDLEAFRSSVSKDIEALRLSMTVRLGSIVMVGVGVILAAFRLWV